MSVRTMPDAQSTSITPLSSSSSSSPSSFIRFLYLFLFLFLSFHFTHRHQSRWNIGTDHVRRAIDQHHAPLFLFLLSLLYYFIIFYLFHSTHSPSMRAEGMSVRTMPDVRSTSITPLSSSSPSSFIRYLYLFSFSFPFISLHSPSSAPMEYRCGPCPTRDRPASRPFRPGQCHTPCARVCGAMGVSATCGGCSARVCP